MIQDGIAEVPERLQLITHHGLVTRVLEGELRAEIYGGTATRGLPKRYAGDEEQVVGWRCVLLKILEVAARGDPIGVADGEEIASSKKKNRRMLNPLIEDNKILNTSKTHLVN
jgi:hypothetical protein